MELQGPVGLRFWTVSNLAVGTKGRASASLAGYLVE